MDPLTFRLYCLPEQEPIDTTVTVIYGWSPSLNNVCHFVSAVNILGDQSSSVAQMSYPQDCIVPEPRGGVAALLLLLVFLARRRRHENTST